MELHLLQMGTIRPIVTLTMQHSRFNKASFPSLAFDSTGSRIKLPKTLRSRSSICCAYSDGGSFLADAVIGRVECSSLGCKPLYVSDPSSSANLLEQENAGQVLESRMAMYHNKVDNKRAGERHRSAFYGDFAEFLSEVWREMATAEKYYQAALTEDRHDAKLLVQYAQFAWSSLQNASKAESLFEQAIAESPCDPYILASYAHFLWQSE